MPPIERFLQQLRTDVSLAGQQYRSTVQLVVGLALCSLQLDLYKDLSQLGRCQARADDRAVKVCAYLPDASPPRNRQFVRGGAGFQQALSRVGERLWPRRRQRCTQSWKFALHAKRYIQ
jgi:hypothetical protein